MDVVLIEYNFSKRKNIFDDNGQGSIIAVIIELFSSDLSIALINYFIY